MSSQNESVSISTVNNVPRKSQIELILATTGFLLVATLCAAAGYISQGESTLNDWGILVRIIGFIFPLWPYYYFREAILEQQTQTDDDVKRWDSVQSSLIYFILSFIISSITFLVFPSIPFVQAVISSLTACLSFGYLGIRTLLAATSQDKLKNEYKFMYRVLFPGLATCIIPFAFGWTIREGDYSVLIISTLFVILGSEICRYKNLSLLRFLMVLFTAIFITSFIMHSYKPLSIIIFGSVLAFGMGAAEACKRVYLVTSGVLPLAEGEDANFYRAGANWATSVFPVLLCLLPLLVTEFPTAPILLYTGIHIFTWQVFICNKSSKMSFVISTLLGYMLPILIIVATTFWTQHHFIKSDLSAQLFAASSALVFFLGIASRCFDKTELRDIFLNKLWKNESYLDGNYSFWLFLITAYFIEVIVFSLAMFLAALDDQSALTYKLKASEIQFGLLILVILRALIAGIQGTFRYMSTGGDSTENTRKNTGNDSVKLEMIEPRKKKQIRKIFAILKIMRPDVSIITGIFVACALITTANMRVGQSLLMGLPITLVTMLGFIFNDLIDYKKDCLTGANKPIAKGIVSKNEAIFIAYVLVILMVIIEWSVGSSESHLVLAATLIGVAVYSYIAQWASWAKGIVTSVLCLSPFAYFGALSGQFVPLPILSCLFIFIFGRELLMDSVEMTGDLRASVKTLAYYLGRRWSRFMAWLSMFFSAMLLFMLVTGKSSDLAVLSGVTLILAFTISWRNERYAILCTRSSMLFGVLAVALSL